MLRRLMVTLGAIPVFVAGAAYADTMFIIDDPNAAISGFTGPYATVLVHLVDATQATVTFNSSIQGGDTYLIGDSSSADVNVNAASWDISGIAGTNSGTGFTPGPFSDTGSGNVASFGTFNQTIDNFDGFTHSADEITFTLTNLSGTWGDSSYVLTPNVDGFEVAMHVFVTDSPADASTGALVTGFATNSQGGTAVGGPVPEPGSVILLGSALLLTSAGLRKRFFGHR